MKTLVAVTVVATVVSLAGCAPTVKQSGVTVWYEDVDGVVKHRPLELHRPQTEFLSTGIMTEGHMPAPAARQ